MRRAERRLLRTAAVSLVAIAVGPVSAAIAAPPSVTITSPLNGSISNNKTPFFSGLAEEAGGEVTLRIYSGPSVKGAATQELNTLLLAIGGRWSVGPAEELKDGTYTAQATQTNLASETGVSLPVTFTVDTAPPTVTLNRPSAPSDDTTPSFTGSASDTTPVTVQIHAGATAKGAIVSTAAATGTGAGWTSGTASPALSSGQYTAVAIQPSSLVGNSAGRSEPVTFTVTPPPVITPAVPPAPAPPTASFKWFPSVPVAGQPVLLMSSSTDAASQITETAWALTGSGPFQGGGAVFITSFSTPGDHVVRLRVTNAYGLSSISTATIEVASPKIPLMQPFPVVRIVGTEIGSGVKLRLLRVQQTPAGARITVRCKGRGCPIKSARAVTVSSRRGVAPVEFRAFERSLRFGLTLEILVSKPGEIGKYTRFAIRRGKLPERVDMCLDEAGGKPLVCPQS
jgi:Big-like domain-containing protein/PKD domain-containing protein